MGEGVQCERRRQHRRQSTCSESNKCAHRGGWTAGTQCAVSVAVRSLHPAMHSFGGAGDIGGAERTCVDWLSQAAAAQQVALVAPAVVCY